MEIYIQLNIKEKRKLKPKEILNKYGINFKGWYTAQVPTKRTISPYLDENCIIAFKKGFIGFVMIIRGVKSHFAFVGIQ
ncbi:unnamed protein product, partial [marine sediment metagenome]